MLKKNKALLHMAIPEICAKVIELLEYTNTAMPVREI